eukprot:CAMPEP_0206296726 /NCGR_PEP_ID=MMETSP0106_2-20121207/5814_1 /ASSEMBLY_ACC=CAM_ASM_000206 /TAXON_ID=81532 /ORGANISM="Acanthoeca-like sp., Strain 10tr" /LENGTH=133 /DNA_ID=CAMNT_0053727387 /DNA_START=192 /DNA_END=590 /DNA_ORIENTATION=-
MAVWPGHWRGAARLGLLSFVTLVAATALVDIIRNGEDPRGGMVAWRLQHNTVPLSTLPQKAQSEIISRDSADARLDRKGAVNQNLIPQQGVTAAITRRHARGHPATASDLSSKAAAPSLDSEDISDIRRSRED